MSEHNRANIIYKSGSAHRSEGAPHRIVIIHLEHSCTSCYHHVLETKHIYVKASPCSIICMGGSAHHSKGAPHRSPTEAEGCWRRRTSHLRIERTISRESGFSWVQPGKGGECAPFGGAQPQTHVVEVKNNLHYRTFVLNNVFKEKKNYFSILPCIIVMYISKD